ncbi:MAG: helix-turn-helix transcriptional regulator [Agathobacter sp.]|nr:helix-turn-helix transcriptional regulator [Agathobacter sp.]
MKSDILELYQAILEPQGIHSLFLQAPYTYIKDADYGFREHIFQNYNYDGLFVVLEKVSDEIPILIYKDDLMTEYCLLLFPKNLQKKYNATHYLIGPVQFQSVSVIEITKLLEEKNLPSHLYNDFMEFYNRVPRLPSRDFWISLLNPLFHEIYDGNVHFEYFEFNEKFLDSYELKDSVFTLETIEARYEAERQLLSAVQMGNLEKAIECHQRFQQFKFSLRATDSLRSRKNLMLTLNTLLRKSIEVSHVHPYYIDRISSDFSIKIEKSVNEAQLEAIALQMLRKYCSLVRNFSTKDLSALVEKCVHQIHFHYADPLSLEILAHANAVSTSYLSSLFHKETGKTITNYINETRINRSILLLNTTDLSVSEIAAQCGFADANYYTRTFKKLKGTTPMAYRKSVNKG